MKLISYRWIELYRSHPKDWTEKMLSPCIGDELEALCRLMGIPYSGTKEEKVKRLLVTAALRTELAAWGEFKSDDPIQRHEKAWDLVREIVPKYKKKQLVQMAKVAKIFYGTNKTGIVLGLLQWRNRCRKIGQNFNKGLQQAASVQYVLPGILKGGQKS